MVFFTGLLITQYGTNCLLQNLLNTLCAPDWIARTFAIAFSYQKLVLALLAYTTASQCVFPSDGRYEKEIGIFFTSASFWSFTFSNITVSKFRHISGKKFKSLITNHCGWLLKYFEEILWHVLRAGEVFLIDFFELVYGRTKRTSFSALYRQLAIVKKRKKNYTNTNITW